LFYNLNFIKISLALQEAEARAEQARRKAAEGQLAFNPSSGNRTSFKKRKKVLSINCLEK